MNYKLQELPSPTNTLDFENVNAPFIVADKNQFFIDKNAEKLLNFTEELRIFTDKDAITIVSNGVKNFFEVDLTDMRVLLDGNMLIVADQYVKDDTPENELTVSTPLNMTEIVSHLQDVGFYTQMRIYDFMLDKNQLRLSNLLSISEMAEKCMSREVIVVESVSPYAENSITSNSMLFSRGEAEETLIPKAVEIAAITIDNDDIDNASFEDLILYTANFKDDYVPEDPKDVLNKKYMVDNGYSLDGMMREPVYIDTVEGSNTPVTKEKAVDLIGEYVSKIDKVIENIVVKRDSSEIENDFIMSSNEVSEYINDYFLKVTDPSIENIDEFEEYLRSLCEYGDDFVEYDFEISGGKVYLGFDYNNMNSVFNNEAVEKILFITTGSFSNDMGRTFDASRYFKDVAEIDKLAAYAQTLGLDFDISIDTIGEVFSSIRGIIHKLCILSPDVIPDPEAVIEIPEFQPSAIIVPPIFTTFAVPYISATVSAPFYLKPFVFFTINAPSFRTTPTAYFSQLFMSAPVYVEDFVVSIVSPPIFPTHFNPGVGVDSIVAPIMDSPKTLNYFSRTDGKVESLLFFQGTDSCMRRYRAVSYRSFNMMDIGLLLAKAANNLGNYFWHSKVESIVLSAPQMIGLFLGDVACSVSTRIDGLPVNVDIKRGFRIIEESTEGEEEEVIRQKLCSSVFELASALTAGGDASSVKSTAYELNGVSVRGDGVVVSDPSITNLEWWESSNISINGWMEYNSDEYKALIDTVSIAISDEINSYALGRRIDDWGSIESREFITSGFTPITTSDAGYGHAMAEYMDIDGAKIGELSSDSNADPMGIEKSAITSFGIGVEELLYPYGNIALGTTSFSLPGTWEEYMADPPSALPGSNKIHIWKPLENTVDEHIVGIEYLGLTDDPNSIFSVYGPVVFIKEESVGTYKYDSIGTDVSVGTKTIDGVTYHTISANNNTVILGNTSSYGPASQINFSRAICDPWLSPLQIYAFVGQAGNDFGGTLGGIIASGGGGGGGDDLQIDNRSVSMARFDEMDENGTPGAISGMCGFTASKISGIDGRVKENISESWTVDTDDADQAEGDVPGALSMSLSFRLTKYVPKKSEDGFVTNILQTAVTKTCVTFGVIDGIANGEGDILAQGMTQDQISQAEGEDKVYIGPSQEFDSYSSAAQKVIGNKGASVFEIRICDMVGALAYDLETGEKFTKFIDITDDDKEATADVKIVQNDEKHMELTPYAVVLVGGFSTPGMVFSYKHAGSSPDNPVVTGYSGSSEVNLFSGTKLTATVPSPVPNVTYSYQEDADALIDSMNIDQGQVHFFINLDTIQVVIPDRLAMLSSKRRVKVFTTDSN